MALANILTTTNRVETPFITVTIGGYTFGVFNKVSKNVSSSDTFRQQIDITFPNFMKSLSVTKINGAVNTYSIAMVYAVRAGDDPNLIEKVLSSASKTRKIKISYGDLSSPTYIYKEESAIITDVVSSIDINSATISYTIKATSESLALTAGTHNFPARKRKPSDVIKELLSDYKTGLKEIFTGMRDDELVASKGLIASDDKVVLIKAKTGISLLSYLNYLVSCMTSVSDTSQDITASTRYIISVFDDTSGVFSGVYFKIVKVAKNLQDTTSVDMYEIDIGYPSNNVVTAFSVNNNEVYSILYDYSKQVQQADYSYRIDDEGKTDRIFAPVLSNSTVTFRTSQSERTWWSQVTQYPISASITIKGLLRPAILMTYLKVNTYFYGRKHDSSGVYIITKQTDNIDESGYRTTLALTRVGSVEIE